MAGAGVVAWSCPSVKRHHGLPDVSNNINVWFIDRLNHCEL